MLAPVYRRARIPAQIIAYRKHSSNFRGVYRFYPTLKGPLIRGWAFNCVFTSGPIPPGRASAQHLTQTCNGRFKY